MKRKIIIITSSIIIILSGLIMLYKNREHYTMKIDGVKLALTLDNNSINYIPKDSDYYVDIDCTNVVGEYLYDENEEEFKLLFKNIKNNAKCRIDFKSNPSSLKSIVENNGLFEDGVFSNYSYLEKDEYTGSAPTASFYATSFSSSINSGDTDPDAVLTFDNTNKHWSTSNLSASRYYYYFFNVEKDGRYQFCFNKTSGNNNNIYIYKGSTNIITSYANVVIESVEKCMYIGNITTSDVIKVVQYTNTTAAEVSSINFSLKISNGTTNAGYRYEGISPNNYLWFNNEIWRIIGSIPTKIDSDGSTTIINLVKIMREEEIGSLSYFNQNSARPEWNESLLYTLLNSYYYGAQNASGNSYCASGQKQGNAKCDYRYVGIEPSGYYGTMVKEVYWNTGGCRYDINAFFVYGEELSTQTVKGRVGMVNLSDYGFASDYNRSSRPVLHFGNENIIRTNWMFLKTKMHVLTNYCRFSFNTIMIIGHLGYVEPASASYGEYVMPVVYLDPSVYVVSGDGSQATPYKIAWPSGS